MSYPLEDFKLYHLTNDDRKLLDELNISLDISYVLKFSNMTFSEAITIPFTGDISKDINKDMSPILLISIVYFFHNPSSAFSSSVLISKGNINNYKKIMSLNNVDKYNIFMLRNPGNGREHYWFSFDWDINIVLLKQLHSEVTEIYLNIFHIQEICKIYNICDDIKKYIMLFIL
jgi:hypothetical protein